jgi:hypothetical protein
VISVYLDEDCQSEAYANALRARGFFVATVNEEGTNGFVDERQLNYATARGWVILTRNTRDFSRIHTARMSQGGSHAGIVCITWAGLGPGALAADLVAVSDRYRSDMTDVIDYVPLTSAVQSR